MIQILLSTWIHEPALIRWEPDTMDEALKGQRMTSNMTRWIKSPPSQVQCSWRKMSKSMKIYINDVFPYIWNIHRSKKKLCTFIFYNFLKQLAQQRLIYIIITDKCADIEDWSARVRSDSEEVGRCVKPTGWKSWEEIRRRWKKMRKVANWRWVRRRTTLSWSGGPGPINLIALDRALFRKLWTDLSR